MRKGLKGRNTSLTCATFWFSFVFSSLLKCAAVFSASSCVCVCARVLVCTENYANLRFRACASVASDRLCCYVCRDESCSMRSRLPVMRCCHSARRRLASADPRREDRAATWTRTRGLPNLCCLAPSPILLPWVSLFLC